MRLKWDERKNRANLRKHGLSFAEAEEIFQAAMVVGLDDREDYGEERWIGIGRLRDRVVVIVFTENDDGTIRVISLRKALRHEKARYEQELRQRLGEGRRPHR